MLLRLREAVVFAVGVFAAKFKEVIEIAFGVCFFVGGNQLDGVENFLNNINEGLHVLRLIQIEN